MNSDLQNYRKKVIRRTEKRCLVTALILLLPGLIMGIFNRWLLLYCIIAALPLAYLIAGLRRLYQYSLTMGRIDDVILVNDLDQPLCNAHVVYKTDEDEERELTAVLGHYGDYEDGIEPKLEMMRAGFHEKYAGRSIPVFYTPGGKDNDFVYPEDSFFTEDN